MSFRTDEFCEELFFFERQVYAEDGEVFDLLFSEVKNTLLSEIPLGIKLRLCDKVAGSSRDLYSRFPDVVFENSVDHGLIFHLSTPFLPSSEDSTEDQIKDYFEHSLRGGEESLDSLVRSGRAFHLKGSTYDNIAFLSYTVKIYDQSIAEAEIFAAEINDRVANAYQPPSLFLCHASEDKPFVDKLAAELDKLAMFAWYDKREILVGDSIPEKINSGLGSSDFLIAVLSPRSISKPWVVREMSSSLMRQLSRDGIRILPLLLEPCDVPPLFTDFKYADFSSSFEQGMADLVAAIRNKKKS